MRPRAFRLSLSIAALLIVGMVAGAGAGTRLVASEQVLFQRQVGTDCGAGSNTLLSPTAGPAKELSCGYIGGGPFGEIFTRAGSSASKVYTTDSEDTLILDASRDVAGTIRITATSAQGVGAGLGQIVVDLTLSGTTVEGDTIELGALTKEVLATPPASRQDIAYTIDLPEDAHEVTLESVSLEVTIRGVHAANGYNELKGNSKFTLPTFVVEDVEDVEDVEKTA